MLFPKHHELAPGRYLLAARRPLWRPVHTPLGEYLNGTPTGGVATVIYEVLASRGRPGAVDEGDKNANHCQREEGNSVLYMHLRVGDDVIDIRDEEKHSQSHTNDCHKDSEVEECRVLHC